MPPRSSASSPVETKDMLIGALLRVPAQAVQRRIITELNAAGFEELRVPHMAVLQYPGPDGVRPSLLAERAGMSKQAMNQLLRSLEGLGYLVRTDAPGVGRARVVRSTERGRAAYAKIHDILRDIEGEWSAVLGPERFAELKELLFHVWDSPLVRGPAGTDGPAVGIPEGGGRSADMRLDIYLNYPGNCEQAFRFYEAELGGRITGITRHGERGDSTALPADWTGKILHARIEIGGTVLMGADIPRSQPMRSAYLSLTLDTVEEAERVYALLAAGGEIFMKMEETFFASRFAMLRDRFGTSWMLLHEHPRPDTA